MWDIVGYVDKCGIFCGLIQVGCGKTGCFHWDKWKENVFAFGLILAHPLRKIKNNASTASNGVTSPLLHKR